jgi:hypothetical protein
MMIREKIAAVKLGSISTQYYRLTIENQNGLHSIVMIARDFLSSST